MSLRNAAIIAGAADSDIGRVPHMSGLGLNAQAARRALDDAGLTLADVDGLLTAYSMTEPYFMLGSVLAEYLGIQPRLCASMSLGGATPAVLLAHAVMAIATGQASVVLIATGENRATGQSRDDAVARLTAVGHPYFEQPYGPLIPGFYAMLARRHMHEYGSTAEQLAAVAVQARRHAVAHPDSPMSETISVEDVLASKRIAEPLRLLDCCLISDGAGALVVTAPERAADLASPPVWVLGIGECHTHEHLTLAPDLDGLGIRRSGEAAYRMAGLGPQDMDFAQLYDCFTVVPVIEAEQLGLAPAGAGVSLFADGASATDGSFPINTHGGLLSYAQAGASGGMHGLVETVLQLRGRAGARQVRRHEVALVHNEGGILSSHATVILGRERR